MNIEDWLKLIYSSDRLLKEDWDVFHDWCEDNNHPYLSILKLISNNFIKIYFPNEYWGICEFEYHNFYLIPYICNIYKNNYNDLYNKLHVHYGKVEYWSFSFKRDKIALAFDLIVKSIRLFNLIHSLK